jgi:hypothetical protein
LRNMYSGNDTRGFVLSNVVWGHTILINRQLMPYILPIPNGIPHDIWMAFKAATIKGIKYIDVPLTKYRQHTDTVTKTIATNYKARTHEKLYHDFMEKLHWIDVMRQHAREDEQSFYNQLFTLYAGKKKGTFQWGLASFLLRNRALLYRFSKKGMLSQMIDALKHARGMIA